MIATSAATSAVTRTPIDAPRIGTLAVKWHRDEPIYLGDTVGGEQGFDSFEGALSGAARAATGGSYVFAVTHQGDRFEAHRVLQPVWTSGFPRENAFRLAQAQLDPITNGRTPQFGFAKYHGSSYSNGFEVRDRRGSVVLDAAAGVDAIVGFNWALVDGSIRDVVAAPGPVTPPSTPDTPPSGPVDPPSTPGDALRNVTEAVRLAEESARIIRTLPEADTGTDATKETRIKAYKTNLAAQAQIEQQFSSTDASLVSRLRTADASLEDANWQLAKKPSPDGRFTGVNVPGALADTERAVQVLREVLGDLGGTSAEAPAPAA